MGRGMWGSRGGVGSGGGVGSRGGMGQGMWGWSGMGSGVGWSGEVVGFFCFDQLSLLFPGLFWSILL